MNNSHLYSLLRTRTTFQRRPSPYTQMNNIVISNAGVKKSIMRWMRRKQVDQIRYPSDSWNIPPISPVLSFIFQQSLDRGEIPTDLRNANIVPIYKKRDRTTPSNYRPVSLTAVKSKMLEHIVVSQIMDHLDKGNILHENQHGCRARRSCESQLLMTTDDITRHLDTFFVKDTMLT